MTYFGTDGIRRPAVFFNDDFLSTFACAAVRLPSCKRVAIGRDTRISGERIERTLAGLFSSLGVETVLCGVLPSPALARCVKEFDCSYGVMITASHNPPEDNGLKLFSSRGAQISAEEERLMEEYISSPVFLPYRKADIVVTDGRKNYFDAICHTHAIDLRGKRFLLDCAYGAASGLAAPLFRAFGAEVVAVCDEKAGEKINVRCGATNVENLFEPSGRFDLAFSYDGDADRVQCVKKGVLYDGDDVSYLFVQAEKEKYKNGVCGTVMTNSGYEKAFSSLGIPFYRAAVGDRNVYEKMVERSLLLGAETSGHVICRSYAETGDGILASLLIAAVDAAFDIGRFPKVKKLPSFSAVLPVTPEQKARFLLLDPSELPSSSVVRSVIRASGTENVVRILCECEDEEEAKRFLRFAREKIGETLR